MAQRHTHAELAIKVRKWSSSETYCNGGTEVIFNSRIQLARVKYDITIALIICQWVCNCRERSTNNTKMWFERVQLYCVQLKLSSAQNRLSDKMLCVNFMENTKKNSTVARSSERESKSKPHKQIQVIKLQRRMCKKQGAMKPKRNQKKTAKLQQ